MQRTLHLFVAMIALAVTQRPIQAEDKVLEPADAWKGSIEDRGLLGKPPTAIANAKDWQTQWDAWKIAGKLPDVDFTKQIVIVQTTVGSQIRPRITLDDQGDLKVVSLATKDLRPGFRYVMVSVSREGVKSVNGKKLDDEKAEDGKTTVSGNVIGPAGELEAGLVVTIRLQDVSLQDAPAKVLGEQTVRDPKAFPIPFSIAYDPTKVSDTGLRYGIGVRIEKDGKLRYINDTHIPVISDGHPTKDVKAPVIVIK